jgi:hypothetical protein
MPVFKALDGKKCKEFIDSVDGLTICLTFPIAAVRLSNYLLDNSTFSIVPVALSLRNNVAG